MPVHDWSRVDAGIYYAFHQQWIIGLSNALNEGRLPPDYYALPEQHAAGFGLDVLTLQGWKAGLGDSADGDATESASVSTALRVAKPKFAMTAETDMEFYRRKQKTLVVRHISGDWVVAMIEVVSPGNKSNRNAMRSFVEKVGEILDGRVHLLILDILPIGRRDPQGIHGAIWEQIAGEEYSLPVDKK